MDLQALREQKAAALDDAMAIIGAAHKEDRILTKEERDRVEALKAKAEDIEETIKLAEEVGTAHAELDKPQRARIGAASVRGPEAKKSFESLGEFVATVVNNPNDQRLSYRSMEMGEGRRGGFLVPEEFRPEIMSVSPQEAIVRPRARLLGSGTDNVKVMPALNQGAGSNMYGGIEFSFVGEKKQIPTTDVSLTKLSVQPKKAAAIVPITNELLRNWSGSSEFITTLLRQGRAAFEDTYFLSGSGAGCPLGVLNAPATIRVKRGAAGKIAYRDIVGMLARLRGTGVFVASQSVLPELMLLKDDEGRFIWQPSAREGEPQTLLGRPLLFNERSPLLGEYGDLVLCDFSYYLIDDGTGPFLDVSEHAKFDTDETLIRMVFNVDGQPQLTGPIIQEGGYKVSPFVALDKAKA